MKEKSIILTLENIGMLQSARLDIGGLSVIAGENDEGKSTVGKALMTLIKGKNSFVAKVSEKDSKHFFNHVINLLFDNQMAEKGYLSLEVSDDEFYHATIIQNECSEFDRGQNRSLIDCTFVQSPLIWDLYNFFSSVAVLEVEGRFYRDNTEFGFKYPYVLWDLYRKISIECPCLIREDIQKIKEYIQEIMHGYFIKKQGRYVFYKSKSNIQVPMVNTATGIKSFGILQVLIDNGYMTKDNIFIFDEPENHLHPTWQVKFAEILVRLVQNQICIMVNTHSPYMLEALHKYGKKYQINANFYLADGGKVEQIDNDNSATLEMIYKKLNQSFISLDEILDEIEETFNG